MTEHLRNNILFFLFLAMSSLWMGDAVAQQDCFDAIPLCNSTFSQNTGFSGSGVTLEVAPNATCLGNGEVNSTWYSFTVYQSGQLELQLNPTNVNDDYDFALYNMTNDSCSGIAAGISQPVSCNYSADTGPTGLNENGNGNQNGTSGSNQNEPLAVTTGESYMLLVSNFTASQNGYNLQFGGSASIVDNEFAVPDSISFRNRCNPQNIWLWFSESFDCSSLSVDDTEITVTGPESVNVTNVVGIGCNDGSTDNIRITFSQKIMTVGTYTITIGTGSDGDSYLDACGNQIPNGTTFTFEVEFIGPELSITNIVDASCGDDIGSAEIIGSSGTPPYAYFWNTSPNQTTAVATNLSPGNYLGRITDSNGCLEFQGVTIENNTPIDLTNSITSASTCNNANDGTAEIQPSGGQAPYTIEWQTSPIQTGNTATGLDGGNLNVIVTDNTGCEASTTVSIPEPSAIGTPIAPINPDCGQANGSATVTATGGSGGFLYQWNTNPPQTTATASNLSAGVYSVVVTDQNGCTANANVILADNFAPNAAIESRIPDCNQQGLGQATAVPSSGTSPYSYQWNTTPPQNTATATGLSEGDYFVTITDAAGCVQIINVKIDTVAPPTISTNLTQPSCGMADGVIEANVTEGIAPYSYSWSSSTNTSNIETGLAEGSYTVTVTDSIGCTDSQAIELEQLPPESEIEFENVCFGEEITFSFTTTSGATSWEWDFGDGNTSTDANPAHTYSSSGDFDVSISLTGGCLPDSVIQIASVFEPPTAAFIIDPELPTTRDDIAFIYTGNGGDSFVWELGDGTSSTESRPTYQYPEDGTYDVFLTVVDANGCEDTITQTIEVLLEPVVYLPNAFIPEGTPENSRFRGYGIGVVSAELSVFNRWGTMVYYSNDIGEILTSGWDGTFNGKPAKQGAYAYKLKSSFYDGSTFQKLGSVTLIR